MIKNKERKSLVKVLITIIILTILVIISYLILKKILYPLNHFEIVKQEASKNNLDPYLIMSIIKTESGFKKYATSKKEAKGLMQIMDSTASEIKSNINDNFSEDLYDENVNIALGCKYFSNLVNKYNGNYYLAICAYNAGMGNVDKWIEQGIIDNNLAEYKNVDLPFQETKKYLNKVIESYNIYIKLYM